VEHLPTDIPRSNEIERLYRERGEHIWRSVLAFAGDPDVASDAVSEAFAQVLRRGDEVHHPERWVWKAAFRIASGELKDRRMRPVTEAMETYEMEGPARDLVVALRALSDKQRRAVVLHDAAGYPAREVARIVGSTEAAVRVHLMRGRRRLRELLKGDDDD
jgi:RNA polymerase sigma-70 factor (ECF subfamily)